MQGRDNFTQKTIEILQKRVAHRCSNPTCRVITIGPTTEKNKANNIGQAAHICAASSGGPRYDNEMSKKERKSIDNAIWLCSNCATKIDRDAHKYTVILLDRWKEEAEKLAESELGQKNTILIDNYIPDNDDSYGFIDYMEIINKRLEDMRQVMTSVLWQQKTYNDLVVNTSVKIEKLNAISNKDKNLSLKNMKKISKLFSSDTYKYSDFIRSQLNIFSHSKKDVFYAITKVVELQNNVPPEIMYNFFKEEFSKQKLNLYDVMESTSLFISKLKSQPSMLNELNKSYKIAIESLEMLLSELESMIILIDDF